MPPLVFIAHLRGKYRGFSGSEVSALRCQHTSRQERARREFGRPLFFLFNQNLLTMEHTWIVSVARSTDWLPFQVALIERLLDKGLPVAVGYSHWSVEVSEWVVFVSAMASVWAEFSRWSDFSWMMRAVYTVRVRRDDSEKWHYVQLKVDNGGVRYGSITY